MAAKADANKGSTAKRTLKLRKPILSSDHGHASDKKNGHTSVFARLQAFLPHALPPAPTTTPAPIEAPPEIPESKYIKIRIVSWNMNESLPKGDLSTLLGGPLPAYHSNPNAIGDMDVPGLSLGSDHPYHIVVIAGQECPTLMRLPLGLGGGMKWDRDKDDDERKRDRKDKDDDKKKKDKPRDKHDEPEPVSGTKTPKYHHTVHQTTGWSTILEDYFSRGIGFIQGAKPDITSPSTNPSDLSLVSPDRAFPQASNIPGMANKDAKWTLPSREVEVPKIGPYELLTKERMMGVYLALYVHRDIRSLVEGFSQGSVTTGLIGGRLGNKGGVAISLKLNGTTLLFLNAHLAAHEDKVALRLANMLKIKSELSIDDFLPSNDERKLREDPTDRFDHTFLCGDLNFRLDVTRVHAEWLIKEKKYAQALEFDQLRKNMHGLGSSAFVGFDEATIDFPPTFKYDVLRTLKGDKKRSRGSASLKQRLLSEVQETPREGTTSTSTLPENAVAEDSDSDSETSRSADDDDASSSSTDTRQKPESAKEEWGSGIAELTLDVRHAAKRKWYHLVKSTASLPASGSPASLKQGSTQKVASASAIAFDGDASTLASRKTTGASTGSLLQSSSVLQKAPSVQKSDRTGTLMPQAPPTTRATSSMDLPRRSESESLRASVPLLRSLTTKSGITSKSIGPDVPQASLDIEDKGVYDTSWKKRVPSWCDRILYKSTIVVPPSPVVEEVQPYVGETPLTEGTPLTPSSTPKKTLFGALKIKSRGGSTPSTPMANEFAAPKKASVGSDNTQISQVPPVKKSSKGSRDSGQSLVIATNLGREHDSPITLSNSGSPNSGNLLVVDPPEKGSTRRTTSPNIIRGSSGGSTTGGIGSLRLHGKRRRSLSATLPLPSRDSVVLLDGTFPASTSAPTVPPLSITEPGKASPGPPQRKESMPGLRRLFSFLPNSFGGNHTPPRAPSPAPPLVEYGPPIKIFKPGEIRCLGYGTLSDREMRELEGRSDHRPIIGRWAVYV